MANHHRGEIDAEIDGARRRLVLTLGALAELEAAFGASDLVALAERIGSGRLSARDLVCIIAAGLRGAGENVSDHDVGRHGGRRRRAWLCADRGRLDRGNVRRRERSAAPSDAAGRTLAPFPWSQAIGFGLGVLRLAPDHFWRMTPRELAFAIEAVCGRAGEPPARATFNELMTRYPDGR
jgi:uncharacterized phage protein (TIGR02216 family)